MRSHFSSIYFFLLALVAGAALAPAQPTPLIGAPELIETLDRLNTLGSVLMLGAHPDDESTTIISYYSRGRHVRTAYLSSNRGEGGQNLIGPEQDALMGVIRTQELLAARRIDGGEQFFTRVVDFGYSKTPEEALEKWGRETLIGDMVRIIRRFRPDVIIARFPPPPGEGGHGQHTAVGHVGPEAYEAAGDPSRYPEQIKQGLEPWKARRYYFIVPTFSRRMQEDAEKLGDRIRIEMGDYDPVLGKSYAEIAGESRSMHRSQSMGTDQDKGPAAGFFVHIAGEKAQEDLFDGIDTSWGRVPGGEDVGRLLSSARQEYDPRKPHEILPQLVEAYEKLGKLDDPWATFKREETLHAIELAAGLWIDATAGRWDATPGSDLPVKLTVLNRSPSQLQWTAARIVGAGEAAVPGETAALPYNRAATREIAVPLAADTRYSQPPWLEAWGRRDVYEIDDPVLIGRPEPPPVLEAEFTLQTDTGRKLTFRKPVVYRWVDSAYGERVRDLQVVPEVAVSFTESNLIFPSREPRAVAVRLQSNIAGAKGAARLEVPAGWKAEPAEVPFELKRYGQEMTVEFQLTPPVAESGGEIVAVAEIGGKQISTGVQTIQYEHIPIQMVYPPARMRVERFDVKLLSKRIGYVMGAGDRVPEALAQLGAAVTMLSDVELATGDLSRFDAIVLGVRAVSTRPDVVAARERLLAYVEQGGTLVTQYNTVSFRRSAGDPPDVLAPYPMEASRDRVAVEEAEVKFLMPDHALLQAPNRITQKDFEGWVQERGLYFMSTWDDKYDAMLSCHDPGEPARDGGMLYARYGKGVYVFSAYAWFRQLPAGVPGAYRLFANIVSAGLVK